MLLKFRRTLVNDNRDEDDSGANWELVALIVVSCIIGAVLTILGTALWRIAS